MHVFGTEIYDWPAIPIPKQFHFFDQVLTKRAIELSGATNQPPEPADMRVQAPQHGSTGIHATNITKLNEVRTYRHQHAVLWHYIEVSHNIICKCLLDIEERRAVHNPDFVSFCGRVLKVVIHAVRNYFIVFYQLLENERNACENGLRGYHVPLYNQEDLLAMSVEIQAFFDKLPVNVSYSVPTYWDMRKAIYSFNQKIKFKLESYIKARGIQFC